MPMANGAGYSQTETESQSEKYMTDWRLQGQEKYLKGVSLQRKQFHRYRDAWEHDHCEFCGAKFTEDDPNTLHEGYTTHDNYHWICDGCFVDFKDLFGWK
jgi:hypothetical protein